MDAKELYFMQKANQVFRYLYYFTSDLQDAAALTVTTFSHVFRKWNHIEQQGDFDTITFSYAHQMASKQAQKTVGKKNKKNIAFEITPPEEIEHLFDLQKLLLICLRAITPNVRSVLILCGIEGFSIGQVSKLFGYTKKRTNSLWQQGMQILQTYMLEQLASNQNDNHSDETDQDLSPKSIVSGGLDDDASLLIRQITAEWITKELSRFPIFHITQWDQEELCASTYRVYRMTQKNRLSRMLTVCMGVILLGSSVSLGQWKYGWVTFLSQNIVYAFEGTVPNLVPELTIVNQNTKSEFVNNHDIIHGGTNNSDAIGALHETVKSAPFNVYFVGSAMQQNNLGGMYLTDTTYDKKKQTLDLEYRIADNVIHVWEAPSNLIKDRYKNLGEQQRFGARPWYVRKSGGQSVYSTVFCGTMIEFQTESLADSMQILEGLYSPSNIRYYYGKGATWEASCSLQKNEDPVNTITQSIRVVFHEQGNGQETVQANPPKLGPITVQVQGAGIHSYVLKDVSFSPGATAYSHSLQYHQSNLPSINDVIHVQIQWQGKTETIDLNGLPQDALF